MIFDFLKKQRKKQEKIKLLKTAFLNLDIIEEQKFLYIQALDVLDEEGINRVYGLLLEFVENLEIKELEEIQKNSFSIISGLRQKEAEEKRKEINSFNFLFNNI